MLISFVIYLRINQVQQRRGCSPARAAFALKDNLLQCRAPESSSPEEMPSHAQARLLSRLLLFLLNS